ncbi:MAG TPA: hypothetical protein VIM53_01475 [Candidatus Saccharimonadales bacterium]
MARHALPPEALGGSIPGVNELAAAQAAEPVFEVDVAPEVAPTPGHGRVRPYTEDEKSMPNTDASWSLKHAMGWGGWAGGLLGVAAAVPGANMLAEAVIPPVTYALASLAKNAFRHNLPNRVGERLETYGLEDDGRIDVRWHPTPGQSPEETDESLRRVVAWAAHSSKVSSLALPMREAERVAPIVEHADENRWPIVDWTEDVLRKKYPDLQSRGEDLVYRATPAAWAELVTETETVAQVEREFQLGRTRIVERIRTLDADNPIVRAYDEHAGNLSARYEALDRISRAQMLKELEYTDRVRLGKTEMLAHGGERGVRVSVRGTLSKEEPMAVLWREANGAVVEQPLADALALTEIQRDFHKLMAEDGHALTPREVIRALTYHLYRDSVEWTNYDGIVEVVREVERQKPLSLPEHSGEKPKLLRGSELGYSQVRLRTKLAALALGTAILAGGTAKEGIAGLNYILDKVDSPFVQSQIFSVSGDKDVAPGGGANYADWQLSAHNMSTEGYWTQFTSNTLTSGGNWTPDVTALEGHHPFVLQNHLPAGHAQYIEVTDMQPSLSDSMANDSNGLPIMLVPVLNNTVIDAASVNGTAADVELLNNNTYAIVLPAGNIDSVRYWLVPDKGAWTSPSSAGVIKTTPKVDAAAMQQVWQQHGYYTENAGEIAGIIRRTGQYELTPYQFQPTNGATWSDELNSWLDDGETGDCAIASTVTALTYPDQVNIASGDLIQTPNASAIGGSEGHQWVVAPDGTVIDPTPRNASAADRAYLDAPVTTRPAPVTFVERLAGFINDSRTKDMGIAMAGLAVAAGLFRRRKAIVHAAQSRQQETYARIIDYRLQRQTTRLNEMGEAWQRAGYMLLNRVIYGFEEPHFHELRQSGRSDDSKVEADPSWLPQRFDFVDARARQKLKAAAPHAKTSLDKRTIKAGKQVMKYASLLQRQRALQTPRTNYRDN